MEVTTEAMTTMEATTEAMTTMEPTTEAMTTMESTTKNGESNNGMANIFMAMKRKLSITSRKIRQKKKNPKITLKFEEPMENTEISGQNSVLFGDTYVWAFAAICIIIHIY